MPVDVVGYPGNENENHSHPQQIIWLCVRNAFGMHSQCDRYATQYPLPNTHYPIHKTKNPNANENYSHQGNFYFWLSSCERINLFYTTINPVYIRIGGWV